MTELRCLVIMPFRADFDPVFQLIKSTAAQAVPGQPLDCFWLKDVQAAGRITDDIIGGIQRSALCIADLTGNNPNVMWETGYAMALGKPTLLLGQNVEQLPFDLRVHRVLPYARDKLDVLGSSLAEAIRQTLARYAPRSSPLPNSSLLGISRSIAVTGTGEAEPAAVQRRVETLLSPYLPEKALWYCGSYGITDETAIQYLLAHEQRVVAVGYHAYDLSRTVGELVEQDKLTFVDASVESVPRGLPGIKRDRLFASAADLVVLLWDGQSSGTRQRLEYFQQHAKNLLLGFI